MDKIKILWVDDEIDLLKPHILFLEKKNYAVTTCNNGLDAITLFEEDNFDIEIKDKRGLSMANQKGIPGFPVEFSMQQGPMLMSFTMTEYNKKVSGKNLFDMTIPEGYVVKTAEELQEMGQ